MTTSAAAGAPSPADDPLPEALGLARGAADASLGLKLLGGLAVRVLCPDFPPRLRSGQDIDFACVTKERKKVAEYLAGAVFDRSGSYVSVIWAGFILSMLAAVASAQLLRDRRPTY